MRYDIIASGSKGNATLIFDHDTLILIDMGITLTRLKEGLSESGYSIDDIDACLFTHDHGDHISGLRFLPSYKTYALEGTLECEGTNRINLMGRFSIGSFDITPVRTSHDAANPCGYILEAEGEKLVYITDTGYVPEETIKASHNPDYLILECNHDISMLLKSNRSMELKQRILSDHGHLCNEDSAIACIDIMGEKTKDIVLAHISEETNTPDVALEAYRKVFRYYGLDLDSYNVRVANQRVSLSGGRDGD